MDSERIKEVLEDLGYKLSDRGSYWQTNAIFRNGDNTTALQIYKDSGVWKDYVNDTSFSPFKRLIQATLGSNDPKDIDKYLKNEPIDDLYTKRVGKEKIQVEEVHDEKCLERLLPHYKFYNEKGINTETLKTLKGGLATSGQMNQRFVFPIYNEYKQIHGFSGRDIFKNSTRPKWKHVGKKNKWVYPLYADETVRGAILKQDEVILVESIGDLLKCHEFGYKNVLVSFGLTLSPKLICTLLELCPQKIVLAFNNDSDKEENRGLNACVKNYLKLLGHFDPDRIMICLPNKNDFGDMESKDFKSWTKKKSQLNLKEQQQYILEIVDSMAKKKSLSKQLLKNKKIILEILNE
ncbi:hypothetical protein CMO96_01830 [Candidatus Woesebacteria bacterium]|nr:hypothetical protein [Candidatus Woesebacteria bacterium]